MITEKLVGHTPAVVLDGNGHSILLLTPAEFLTNLARSGVVVLRNFNVDSESFGELVRKHSSHQTFDPARQTDEKGVQKVDAGTAEIGLHLENGTLPMRPEICWFYCVRAAKSGSQTTYCDGVRVWQDLSPATRKLFSQHDLKYCRTVSAERWKKFVKMHRGDLGDLKEITFRHLLEMLPPIHRQNLQLKADGSLYTEFIVPAAPKTRLDRRLTAFANSLLGPSFNYESPRIVLDNDQEIPESVMKDVREKTKRWTENIDWQDGDVAIIDNTRTMHGRREILDPNRSLFNALSFHKATV